MDLKLILILLILFIAIGLFIKDYLIFKKKVLITNEETNADVKIIKNRLNLITNEIKTYNSDLITQFKKINTINSQKITSMSNYYTESESNENNHLIEYLSEQKNDLKINFRDILSDGKVNSSNVEDKITKIESATSSDLSNINENEQNLDESENSSNTTKSTKSTKSSTSTKSSKSINSVKMNPICFDENTNLTQEVTQNVSKSDNKTTESELIVKLQTIQPITSYSKTDLENIAKIHLIPITYQDGTQRKTYKKEELYNKIKDHFENLKLN
jgi:hypothetical protein